MLKNKLLRHKDYLINLMGWQKRQINKWLG